MLVPKRVKHRRIPWKMRGEKRKEVASGEYGLRQLATDH